ncbi:MAG: LamB/YcsF family protein [Phycisphaerales bacterium]
MADEHDHRWVHLGCDTGEAPAGPLRERELLLMEHVSAVSIACGGHAGDHESMRVAVEGAIRYGCVVGAHPSYPDRQGFGRKAIELNPSELLISLIEQMAALRDVCGSVGATVEFVKPHGALYHAASNPETASMIAEATGAVYPNTAMVGAAGSAAVEHWRAAGIRVLAEGFIDRAYEPGGMLRSRGLPGALITDPKDASERAVRLARGEGLDAHQGGGMRDVRMLCVHSDTPHALAIASAARRALTDAGIGIGVPM